jgi:thiol-disulfide isomerase/thioredoxin
VVASSLAQSGDDESCRLIDRARMAREKPGSERYQQNHMSLIFQDGLSFSGFERNKVFIAQDGPKYIDLSDLSGADSEGDCRATVVADFDDDGDPDLFVNAIQRDCHMLYRNDAGVPEATGAARRAFVKVRLRASAGHPDAIGATVRLRRGDLVQAQVLSCGTGFEAQNAPEIIFGLGEAREAKLSVRWPGRKEEDFGRVEAGGRYLLVEGSGAPQPFPARRFSFPAPLPRGLRLRPGAKVEKLSLLDLEGREQQVTLAGDKPLVLAFWASTCSSCLKELPVLEKAHRSQKRRAIGISLDPPANADAVRRIWERFGLKFDSYLLSDAQAQELFDLVRLSIPLSMFLRADGVIERVHQGALDEQDF